MKMKANNFRVTIREAEENDADAIKRIVDSVAKEKYYIVPERSRENWKQAIKEIKERKGLILVAEINEMPVGMAHLVPGRFEKNKHVGFLGICILKEFRGKGIGTKMMEYMIKWAKEHRELEKISLNVFSTNRVAIKLYRKFGFEIEGICKKQFKIEDKYVDEIIMGKWLT